MARIRTYELDTTLTNNDYLLGNDGDNGTVITKRFGLDTLRSFILDNTGLILTDEVPPGFLPAVDHQGADVESAPIRVTETPRLTTPIGFSAATAITGFTGTIIPNTSIELEQTGSGNLQLNFIDYTGSYRLEDFGGIGVRIIDTLVPNGEINATFASGDNLLVRYDTNNNEVQTGGREFRIDTTGTTTTYTYSLRLVSPSATITTTIPSIDGIVLDTTPIQHEIVMGNITVGTIDAISITTSGTSCFNGPTNFKDTVTIGTDGASGVGEADLHVHGTIHLDDDQGGISFGIPEPAVTLTTDGDNLTVGGQGDVTFALSTETGQDQGKVIARNPVDLENSVNLVGVSSISVLQEDGTEFATPLDILPVVANDPSVHASGPLRTLRIGDNYFQIPTTQSQTAFVLPGLSEGLSPVPGTENIMTGSFFYAVDQGTTALFDTAGTDNTFTVAAQNITAGQTTATVSPLTMSVTETFTGTGAQRVFTIQGDVANDGSDITVSLDGTTLIRGVDWQYDPGTEHITFTAAPPIPGDGQPNISVTYTGNSTVNQTLINAFAGIPNGNRLFFIPSTSTLPTAGDVPPATTAVVPGDVYEVVSYLNGVLTFSLLGAGNIIISAPEVSLTNIPTQASNDFVVRQADNTLSVSSLTEIAGAQAQVTYTDENTQDVNVRCIEFVAANNSVTDTTPGEIRVDVTGRFQPFMAGAEQTTGFSPATPFQTLVLGEIATEQTVTLPQANPGDSFKIINLSTIGDAGDSRTSSTWSIAPHMSQRIMKLALNTPMRLNDPTASFEISYVSDAAGWVIIGIN